MKLIVIPIVLAGLAAGAFSTAEDPPAPEVDRVGFPKDYREKFAGAPPRGPGGEAAGGHRLRERESRVDRSGRRAALSLRFDHRDGDGERPEGCRRGSPGSMPRVIIAPTRSPACTSCGGRKDFGEAYGKNRTGEWEYVEYRADGSYITPPKRSFACAECHVKAGRERDFVYRGKLPPKGNP